MLTAEAAVTELVGAMAGDTTEFGQRLKADGALRWRSTSGGKAEFLSRWGNRQVLFVDFVVFKKGG